MRLEPIKGRKEAVTAYLRPIESDTIRLAAKQENMTLAHFARECMIAGFNMRINEREIKS